MKRVVAYVLIWLAGAVFSYHLGKQRATLTSRPVVAVTRGVATLLAPGSPPTSPGPVPPQLSGKEPAGNSPFSQDSENFEIGYAAAQSDLAAALKKAARLPTPDLKGFTTGLFTFVARQRSPSEAFSLYKQLPKRAQPHALRALVAEWAGMGGDLNPEQRYLQREEIMGSQGRNMGLEVDMAYSLAPGHPDETMTKAWLEAFSDHPGRAEILMALGRSTFRENPDAALEWTIGWSEWERERVVRNALETLTRDSPAEAWQWYMSRKDQFTQDLSSSIFAAWADSDPAAVQEQLNSLTDPAQRLAAIESLGKVLAVRNTDEAVVWANSLQDPGEQQAAHRSLYDSVPRGIGAVIAAQDGFPTIRGILPGSPLEGLDVQPGDRLVEVRSSDGLHHPLYGTGLSSAIEAIRGEPGTEITLRILRTGVGDGQVEEHWVPVKRQQLYLHEIEGAP